MAEDVEEYQRHAGALVVFEVRFAVELFPFSPPEAGVALGFQREDHRLQVGLCDRRIHIGVEFI